jgi:hypothetical protein
LRPSPPARLRRTRSAHKPRERRVDPNGRCHVRQTSARARGGRSTESAPSRPASGRSTTSAGTGRWERHRHSAPRRPCSRRARCSRPHRGNGPGSARARESGVSRSLSCRDIEPGWLHETGAERHQSGSNETRLEVHPRSTLDARSCTICAPARRRRRLRRRFNQAPQLAARLRRRAMSPENRTGAYGSGLADAPFGLSPLPERAALCPAQLSGACGLTIDSDVCASSACASSSRELMASFW